VIAAREQAATKQQVIEDQQRVIQDRETRLRNLEQYQLSMQETTRGTMMRLTDERLVLFDSGQAALTPAALEPLKNIAVLLNLPENKARRVHVAGYTDATGSAKLNQELAATRAARVTEVLAQEGASRERLMVRGYGKRHPIADNNTEAGWAQNRRVGIILEHAQQS
jgi:outer membrane protein OmpA-like peptidoglycan-associated protein